MEYMVVTLLTSHEVMPLLNHVVFLNMLPMSVTLLVHVVTSDV